MPRRSKAPVEKRPHYFELTNPKDIRKIPIPGKNYWWCKRCDSIVLYPHTYSKTQINNLMNQSRLMCLPPVAGMLRPN